jgi:hypothetical protein
VHGLKVVIEKRKAQAPERAARVDGVLRMHVKATRAGDLRRRGAGRARLVGMDAGAVIERMRTVGAKPLGY